MLNNDNDLDLPFDLLTVSSSPVSGPSIGNLTLNGDGTFVYIHDGSENFSDSFVYRVNDEVGASDTALVTISITPVNDRPTTTGLANFEVDENSADTVINLETYFDDIEDGSASLTYTVEGNTAPELFAAVPVLISGSTLICRINLHCYGQ